MKEMKISDLAGCGEAVFLLKNALQDGSAKKKEVTPSLEEIEVAYKINAYICCILYMYIAEA